MRLRYILFLRGSAILAGTLATQTGWAQVGANADEQQLREVVVTAQKSGAQSLQQVPLAITAFTDAALLDRGSTQLSDLTYETPGFTYAANGPWAISTIRGVGTNNVFAGGDPSTTLQVDGVYYGRPTGGDLDFLDVERVEILRGPQGTLYGRNADAGTINVITKDPTSEFSGIARATGGNYGLFRPEFSVSGPLVDDTVLLRVSAMGAWHDGYIHDLTPGLPDQWDQNHQAIRSKVLFKLQPNLRFVVNMDFTNVNEYMNASYVRLTPPPFPDGTSPSFYQTSLNHPYFVREKQGGASGTLTWDAGPITLTSISAYRRSYMNNGGDLDYTRNEIFWTRHFQEDQNQLSEELDLSGKFDRFKFVAGTFLYREYANSYYNALIYDSLLETQGISVTTRSAAVFGQGTYNLTDTLALIAGLRYTHDSKDSANIFGTSVGPPPVADVSAPTSQIYAASPTYSATTPKFGIDWSLRRDLLAYASATKGYKSGGSNLLANPAALNQTLYGPESVWAYEAGLKQTLRGSVPATIDVSVFHNDYKGLQVNQFIFTPTGAGQLVRNAPGAITYGAELETTVMPTTALRLGATAAYLHARYHGTFLSLNDFTQVSFNADGKALDDAPLWSGSIFAQYAIPVRQAELSFRAEGLFKGAVYYTPLNDPREGQGDYALLNLGARFSSQKGWEMGLLGKNIAGRKYITAAYYAFSDAGTPGEPRTVQAYVGYTF